MGVLQNQHVERLIQGNAFFFAGSGVSFHSSAPTAGQLLEHAVDLLLPAGDEHRWSRELILKNANSYSIQPEVFYETVISVLGNTDILHLWKCLSPPYLSSLGVTLRPNINHLFVADYSVRNQVPLFTTNFDCLFEQAAGELGYGVKIILPFTKAEKPAIKHVSQGSIPRNTLYLFKLHGSVADEAGESLDSLCATMTEISRTNFPVVDLIQRLSARKHLTFLGYSGRDLDYFQEIAQRQIGNQSIWIDRFVDPWTNENCQTIDSSRVLSWPDELFAKLRPDLDVTMEKHDLPDMNAIVDSLTDELRSRLHLRSDDQTLLLGQLIRQVGHYHAAYETLLPLASDNTLDTRRHCFLLHALSSLAHENSQFESSRSFAIRLLELTHKAKGTKEYKVLAQFHLAEADRMLLPHDTSFPGKSNWVSLLRVLVTFGITGLRGISATFLLKRTLHGISHPIHIAHGQIEHWIRALALIQAGYIERRSRLVSGLRRSFDHLIKWGWYILRQESRKHGYGQGVANTLKYEFRLSGNPNDVLWGQRIYKLTVYETGIGLSSRNMAENLLSQGDYLHAKEHFIAFYDSGVRSGNRLNAVKGLLGMARCNILMNKTPALNPTERASLEALMSAIEGARWQSYFTRVLREIDSNAEMVGRESTLDAREPH